MGQELALPSGHRVKGMVSVLLYAVSAGAERHCIVVFFSDTVITFAFVSLPGFRLKFALSHSIVILLLALSVDGT